MCEALRTLRDVCMRVLYQDPESEGLSQEIEDHITMTMLFGCDHIQDTFEVLEETGTHWEEKRDKVASEREEPAVANKP